MSQPTKHALTVLAAPQLHVAKDDLTKLQAAACAQLSAVAEMESKAALGGILAGLTLHRVKASMKHGTFGDWLKNPNYTLGYNLTASTRVKNANFLMRLALVFLEKTRAQVPDLLALPGDQLSLELADNAAGKALAAKLQKFVGECSLNELLIKHGIKGVVRDGDAGTDGEPKAVAVEDYFAEVAQTLTGWRDLVTSREKLMRLSPQQLDTLHQTVQVSYAEFRKLYAEARGTRTADVIEA